jgi:D-alanyl-D-alanine carboxypeptidase (penicillin-binding protein 5/6)
VALLYESRNVARWAQNRRRPRKKGRLLLAVLVDIVLFVLLFQAANQVLRHDYITRFQSLVFDRNTEQIAVGDSRGGLDEAIAPDFLGGIHSPHAILVDLASGRILAERHSQQRIYPASLTKMMTALLAVEYSANLDEEVELPRDIYYALYEKDAALAGFEPGETVRVRDLLYGVLLASGAESSLALANRISGSETAFVDLMNQKAQQLGMVHTRFGNATGLHDEGHYSTVEDLSILLRYALQNETFRTVFTSSRYSVQSTNRHPIGFTFWSTMFMYMKSAEVPGGEILGGKTGYTEEAGQCLASLARINGREYILVTVGANGKPLDEHLHILDAVDVYGRISVWDSVRSEQIEP